LGTPADKKVYINAKSSIYKSSNKGEKACAGECGNDSKCEMYLMQSKNKCHLFNNVSGVTKYKTKGNNPPHEWWGKEKKEIVDFMTNLKSA
jgi:hypothetical protein